MSDTYTFERSNSGSTSARNSMSSLSDEVLTDNVTSSPWISRIFRNTSDRATDSSAPSVKIETSFSTETRAVGPISVFSRFSSRLSTMTPARLGFRMRNNPGLPETLATSFNKSIPVDSTFSLILSYYGYILMLMLDAAIQFLRKITERLPGKQPISYFVFTND